MTNGAGNLSVKHAEQPAADEQAGDAAHATQRAGEDTRRRGWFWHWNNVITQYAPLLGLKGVGLLNSYTVWTDRREESPHRGYAFPSQQAEAGFYGEERAELITINKILVALDLIEIRKEMLTRVDGQGRRWKVPHNLYRVKDRPDGIGLRVADVLQVVELAERDDDVYRYIRRVFSSRFAPIDRDNVWHQILEELGDDPRWQALQARTAVREAKASARTRAGHDTRAGKAGSARTARTDTTAAEETSAVLTTGQIVNDTVGGGEQLPGSTASAERVVARSNTAAPATQTTVAGSNTGWGTAVAASNEGLGAYALGSVATSNDATRTAVGQSNTTYDQRDSTTTTTTTTELVGRDGATSGHAVTPGHASITAQHDSVHGPDSTGIPLGLGEALAARAADECSAGVDAGIAVSSADAALHHATTPPAVVALEPHDDAPACGTARSDHGRTPVAPGGAHAVGYPGQPVGDGPVADPSPLVVALFEAANNRRVTPLERLLLGELERATAADPRRTGPHAADLLAAAIREAVSSGSTFVAPKRIQEIVNRWLADGQSAGPAPAGAPAGAGEPSAADPLNSQPTAAEDAPVRLPGGRSGTSTWKAVLSDLAQLLDPDAFQRLLAESAIVRYRAGCVEVRVATPAAAEKLSTEYHALVTRRLNERLPRPVDVRFSAPDAPPATPSLPAAEPEPAPPGIVISRADADAGRQLWRAVLLGLGAALPSDDWDRLREVVPLGQDAAGRLLLGVPTRHVARLLEGRYRAEIERACADLLQRPITIAPLASPDWSLADA